MKKSKTIPVETKEKPSMTYPLIIVSAVKNKAGQYVAPKKADCFTVLLEEAHMKTLCNKGKAASRIFQQIRAAVDNMKPKKK